MTTDQKDIFQTGVQYSYHGIVTGPFKVHRGEVILTKKENSFYAEFDQEGEKVSFDVAIKEYVDGKYTLLSEPFKLPSTSEMSNLEMICQAELTESELTGVIDIPAYSVRVSLDLKRVQ